jgi:hypothetical protein
MFAIAFEIEFVCCLVVSLTSLGTAALRVRVVAKSVKVNIFLVVI